MFSPRFQVLSGMVLVATLSRLLPHPWNFTPIAAIALFGGATFSKKWQAFLVPLLALLISDLVIGFYAQMPIIYLSFSLVVFIGFWLKHRNGFVSLTSAVLTSSLLFFLITNVGVWAFGTLYPKTLAGLMQCYIAGIPYYRNMVLGDAFYATLLFGGLALCERAFPIIRRRRGQVATCHIYDPFS